MTYNYRAHTLARHASEAQLQSQVKEAEEKKKLAKEKKNKVPKIK